MAATPYHSPAPCRGGRVFYHLVLAALAFTAGPASAQVPDLPGWDLVWNDEFDGNSLNTTNWTALDRRDSFNNEKQYYHPNQVVVTGGNLELTAINVPRAGKAYQSGLITSKNLFGHGRFEARINLPTSQGMWPAFWLNANQIQWPLGGEIDIMENRGSQPNLVSSAYHWQTNPGPCCDQRQFVFEEYTSTEGGQPVNFHDSFHTYAAEWDETSIRFYVDGNLYHTINEAPNRPIIETPKNIIVNLAVGGTFGGDPNGSTVWPQTMQVDYVRYWQPSSEPPIGVNLLNNPGFDNNGGSLNNWTILGNPIGNVSANDDLFLDGSHALKIYGQFNGSENFSGVSQGVAVSPGDALRAEATTQSPAWDTLFGKTNEVTMQVEFYSSFGAGRGSSAFLGEVSQLIHDGSTQQNAWLDHSLEAVAPAGAVEARLTFLFRQPGGNDGAVWIDSAGLFLDAGSGGDFDGDGDVDLADALSGQRSGEDLGTGGEWHTNFGSGSTTQSGVTAVPEPAPLLLLASFAGLLRYRRTR